MSQKENGNVKCPVHGEHGLLSQGKCWYCVQSGAVSVSPKKTLTKTQVVGKKRKIA